MSVSALKREWNIVVRVTLGALLSSILGVALPLLLHTRRESGATAAAVDTGAFAIIGVGIGVGIGAAVAAALTPGTNPFAARLEKGVFAGYISAGLVALPALLIALHLHPVDIAIGLFVAAFFLTPFILVGAVTGSGLAILRPRATR